jgi:hypothetical protein
MIMRFFLLVASTLAALTAAADITTLHLVIPDALEATSDADMLQHYAKPPACDSDEQAFAIGGIPGMVRP